MDRLIAKDAIQDVMYRMAYAEDELDRDALLDLFIPDQTFTFDISGHLADFEPMETTPNKFWESAYHHLSGFTATQHLLGNAIITFEDDQLKRAHVKSQVHAYHCLEREGKVESVTAHGLWLVDVEFWEGKWVCRKVVIRRDVPLERPELYEVAKARVERGECRKPKQ